MQFPKLTVCNSLLSSTGSNQCISHCHACNSLFIQHIDDFLFRLLLRVFEFILSFFTLLTISQVFPLYSSAMLWCTTLLQCAQYSKETMQYSCLLDRLSGRLKTVRVTLNRLEFRFILLWFSMRPYWSYEPIHRH